MFIDKIKKVLVVAACGMLISGNCFGMKEVKINVSSLVKTVHTKEYTVCKTIEEMHNFMVCAFLEKLEVPLIEAIETIIANTAEEVCGFNAENVYKTLPEKD
jgi:hypothetical protein